MLNIAEKYQEVFELLASEDSEFTSPTCDDWVNTRAFLKLLESFYDVTLNISGCLNVTANTYFPKFCILEYTLNDMCKSNDPIMSVMAINLKNKYDKYWENIDRINLMICVAFVLDQRYKIMAMTFWLKRCKGDELANKIEAVVRLLLSRLIEEYNAFHGVTNGKSDMAQERFNATSLNDVGSRPVSDDFDSILNQFLEEESHIDFRLELDRYLLDGREARSPNFDILAWWKMNAVRYPILPKIARDVLATLISTIDLESAFSTERRILDPFRSSLDPNTVEALICTQSWLRNKPIDVQELEQHLRDICLGG